MVKSQRVQELGLPKGYKTFLEELKKSIKSAQIKAVLSVNEELILLYWDIGKKIVQRQRAEGWGKSTVEQLANDLTRELFGLKGFSPQNIWYMRAFYLAWSEESLILQQPVGELEEKNSLQLVRRIPWGQNIVLFTKIKNVKKRFWYAQKIIQNGWSRAVLIHQIESNLCERQAKSGKLTNFIQTLPNPQSDLAHEMIKDPYNFEFLALDTQVKERKLHDALIQHLQKFLIELGVGFAFVGSEYHMEIGNQDFYIDLLFYHLKLRCYVVIELKTVAFNPEFAGKMNFYLSAIDDLLRIKEDKPTIGLILCKSKNETIVEYTLKDSKKPMGVSSYKLMDALPEGLRGKLPSVKQIEEELRKSE